MNQINTLFFSLFFVASAVFAESNNLTVSREKNPSSRSVDIKTIVNVTISSVDGFTLAGTMYSASQPGPGVLLLQPCGSHAAKMFETRRELVPAIVHWLTETLMSVAF